MLQIREILRTRMIWNVTQICQIGHNISYQANIYFNFLHQSLLFLLRHSWMGINQNFTLLFFSFGGGGLCIGSSRLHFTSFASAFYSTPKSLQVMQNFAFYYTSFEEETPGQSLRARLKEIERKQKMSIAWTRPLQPFVHLLRNSLHLLRFLLFFCSPRIL